MKGGTTTLSAMSVWVTRTVAPLAASWGGVGLTQDGLISYGCKETSNLSGYLGGGVGGVDGGDGQARVERALDNTLHQDVDLAIFIWITTDAKDCRK